MRLQISKSKNSESFYIVESIYVKGKRSNRIFKKLGTLDEIKEKIGDDIDPYEWGKEQAKYYTKLKNEGKLEDIQIKLSQSNQIEKGNKHIFNIGYLFLQSIYYSLNLDKLCKDISKKYEFDFNDVFSKLIYSKILSLYSNSSNFKIYENFIEDNNFENHELEKSLEILSENSYKIQSFIYKSLSKIFKRNTNILYYDSINFPFKKVNIEDGIFNSIRQMELFMDGNCIPMAFYIHPLNQNEKIYLNPLEEEIIFDFNKSMLISNKNNNIYNKKDDGFNTISNKGFIETQSVKSSKKFIKDWALDPKGFKLKDSYKTYDITKLDEYELRNNIFYKDIWYKENKNNEHFILFYDNKLINEEYFNGLHLFSTDLDIDPFDTIKIYEKRKDMEEFFRINEERLSIKGIYLERENIIEVHFLLSFIALTIYRILENLLSGKYTCKEIIDTLKDMNVNLQRGFYLPIYERTDLTDDLHDIFNFRTDLEIISPENMRNIIKKTKNWKY